MSIERLTITVRLQQTIVVKYVTESEHIMSKKQKKTTVDLTLYNSLFAQHDEMKANMNMLRDAYNDNMLFNAHCEAIKENNVYENRKSFSNKEKNAEKRALNKECKLSMFCKSMKKESQAFRLDVALSSFHTMRELQSILSDCTEAKIKSHISFLKHRFSHVCSYEEKKEDRKVYFRFVLKKDVLLDDYLK